MSLLPQALDALNCPLTGINLIEASAGTGKTWTIAALFARLLLEERDGQPPPTVDQVLVVTYTKAATAELRERLRRRLSELAQTLSGEGEVGGDPFLSALAARFPPGAAREQASQRLKAAITGFDAAAIYTIHGFCQRVLTDAAFESSQTFEAELVSDDEERLTEIVDDFWRRRVVDDPLLAQVLVDNGETPDGWLADIRPYLSKPYLRMCAPHTAGLERALLAVEQGWRALAARPEYAAEAADLLRSAAGFNARSYSSAIVERAIGALDSQLTTPETTPVLDKESRRQLDKLLPASLAKGMKKGHAAPEHPLFELVEAWLGAWDAYLDEVALSVAQLKLELIAWTNEQLSARRAGERSRSFDDLLTDLGAALADPISGPLLAAHVARSFQVALIDEFQDTDPIQYAIFRHCFVAQQRPVFLVGDPKQAIYSFRGADIFAYLAARGDAQHHYTLDTNRRSEAPLVSTVNTLFARELPFLIEGIAYQPVAAQPASGGRLEIDDDRPSFCFQWLQPEKADKAASGENAAELAANASADEIARLLALAAEGRAAIVAGDARRPLAGGDIAVLVSTHRQGDRVRQALAERGVASVALTQESVFASREAGEMLALLRAWAEPASEARLRAALVTELAGVDAGELLARVEDETRWEAQLQANAADHLLWRERGFMAAWRHFFARERVAERLLPLPDGERRLTNLSHLAELLQQESDQRQGMAPLLGWLETRVAQPPGGEEAVLRLESDAALVKIVTIHTAKGLQYPVAFCPFLWGGALERRDAAFWRYHAEDQSWLAPDAAADAGVKLAARSELLAEKLRLLYVALTRAQYRQYLCWGWVRGMETAALSWLLHGRDARALPELEALELDAEVLRRELGAFAAAANAQAAGACAVLEESGVGPALAARRETGRNYLAQTFSRRLAAPWRVASFTSLTHAQAAGKWQESPDHDAGQPAVAAELQAPPVLDRFGFPRGAKAGTCLHEIFETISFGVDAAGLRQAVELALAKHGFAPEWGDAACEMVTATLNAELDPGVRLAEVPDGKRLVEMEFMLPAPRLEVAKLAAILSAPEHGLAAPLRAAAAQLDFSTVRGFLKGFMDLVFESGGRIYLVDYKSNHLGGRHEDYRAERLAESIAQEHYYLQYLIYCVALRRYFSVRGVDFAARFGGVRYLYLRGVGVEACGIWSDQPAPALLEALDQWFAGHA
ncbi:exodeoxyribonuclease V subunit beta [Chromobacterium haemolyticum]|uniref:exodeoxyribonuclease V subunit beta n=1 Tax=Chromobacterium haemolyticum TaxID=394935 RepID=UPI0009D9426E|nr:exodeoxyribonuclease V subunit beta [Chromobacterium haemolyticum]OQS36611.1 exodeoxyribonuclease V subunit beta [Chromobacterium haemolyticum]